MLNFRFNVILAISLFLGSCVPVFATHDVDWDTMDRELRALQYKYLINKDLANLRLTNKQVKNIVDTYVLPKRLIKINGERFTLLVNCFKAGLSPNLPQSLRIVELSFKTWETNDIDLMSKLTSLTNLKLINVPGNNIVKSNLAKRIGLYTDLTSLDFSNNGTIPVGHLTLLTNLTELNLENNSIDSSVTASLLMRLNNLESLNLINTRFTKKDTSLSVLPKLTRLKDLNLQFDNLKASVSSYLTDLINLRSLSVRYKDVTDEEKFKSGLRSLTQLEHLNMQKGTD